MGRPRWIALVAFLAVLWAALPAQAGTESDPELTDPAGDQTNPQLGMGHVDIVKGWVAGEDAAALTVVVQVAAAGDTTGQEMVRRLTLDVDGNVSEFEGATADGVNATFRIPKSEVEGLAPGSALNISAQIEARLVAAGQVLSADEATAQRPYIVGAQAAPGVDSDGDGIGDAAEVAQGTHPGRRDTDGDGLEDGREQALGSDPLDPDTDDDGLSDGREAELGSDPTRADSDSDGRTDAEEEQDGTDPTRADTDGDGLNDGQEHDMGTDPLESDTDGDGLPDGLEAENGSDPLRADPDIDGDGMGNAEELEQNRDPYVDEDGDALDGPLPWILAGALVLVVVVAIVALSRRPKREESEQRARDDATTGYSDGLPEEYLRSGLSEEEIEDARRRFEERQRRYDDFRRG